jgi:transposase
VSDDEWAFCAPYLTLMTEDAPQREYALREVFNGLRWLVRAGATWRMMPHDLPPWPVVYQQTQRWLQAEVFEAMVQDVRELLRMAAGRDPQPSAVVLDSRTLQSSPESGARAGYDGAKRKRGSKVHMAVDTLGHLLALRVTPADAQDRAQVAALAQQVQAVTGEHVEIAYVDQGYSGEAAAQAAAAHGIQLEVVKLPHAKKGFVLLPRRWVVERSFAWAARFRRLARDYERLPETLAGLHFLAFAILLLARAIGTIMQSA